MRKIVSLAIISILILTMLGACAGTGMKTTEAVLPKQSYGGSLVQFMEGDNYSKWIEARREYLNASREIQPGLMPFYGELMETVLSAKEENTVCSPVNVYIALAMLAETASGDTRQQILDALGASDIGTLRSNVKNVWNANYSDNPAIKSQLANSLWLRDDLKYSKDILETLAEDYYADSYVGQFGSDEMNKALGKWTDDHTGGLLRDYTKDMKIDDENVMELVSAIYFKGTWTEPFREEDTEPEVFHGKSGDTQCEMMSQSGSGEYFWGDHFTAIFQDISYGGGMYFFLPDEDSDLTSLFSDPQVLDLIQNVYAWENENSKYMIINKKIPKLSLSSRTDLKDVMKTLGITDALDPMKADFSELSDFPDSIWLDKAEHAALVEIDEEGVTGAAYTDLAMAGGAMPPTDEVDFVLDRPFMYAVVNNDGTLLFAGTVYDIP